MNSVMKLAHVSQQRYSFTYHVVKIHSSGDELETTEYDTLRRVVFERESNAKSDENFQFTTCCW